MKPLCPGAVRMPVLAAALLGAPRALPDAAPLEWTFDHPAEVTGLSNIEYGRVEGGALAGSTAWDPHFSLRCPKEGFDAAQLTALTVRMYSSAEADLFDVYYGSPDGNWCLGGRLPVRKGWATYRLDLSKNNWRETTAGNAAKQWGGPSKRVSAFRIDPGNQAARWISIDRVRIEPMAAGFAEGVTAEPRGSATLQSLRVPKTAEAGETLAISAAFGASVPKGLEKGTVFLRLRHGAAVVGVKEEPVSFAGGTLTIAAGFPLSRYWNPGTLTVEAGCYELDGAAAQAHQY